MTMEKVRGLKVYLITMLGAACWGLIGLFIAPLYDRGFTAWDVVAVRSIFTAVFLLVGMAVFNRSQLKTRLKDHVFFAGAGVLSISLFNFFYFEVFSRTSLSLAVTLLYTGPVFVTILSRIFFKEPLTLRKGWALVLAMGGCALVVGLLPFGQVNVTWAILLMGILSGFCYALYSIFSKAVIDRYSPLTVTLYTFLYASIFMLLTSDVTEQIGQFQYADVWISSLLLSLVSTIAAFALYTYGLKHLEASKASILATVEPIVAVVIGVVLFHESLQGWQVLGILLVLYSAVLVTRGQPKDAGPEQEILAYDKQN